LGSTTQACLYAVALLRPLLGIRRLAGALAPCLVAAFVAAAACYVVLQLLPPLDRFSSLAVAIVVYAGSYMLLLRVVFTSWLNETLRLAPFRQTLSRMLLLPTP
jgi:hypothetical protein